VHRAGRSLREQARYYEQNHDLARGVLAELVAKTVGPCGIMVEPQPRWRDGTIHDDLAGQLLELYRDWSNATPR
jgi:capsid protein